MYRIIMILILAAMLLTALTVNAISFQSSQGTIAPNSGEVISAIAPLYPNVAEGTLGVIDVSGDVLVEAQVDGTGTVASARALRGHPLLQMGAMKAARRWKFAPCATCGVARAISLSFIFRMMPRGMPEEELMTILRPPNQVEVRRISVKAKPNNGMQRTHR